MRIAIIAKIRLYREGLADVLGRQEGMEVVGAASDGDAGVATVRALRPDIALLDMTMLDSADTVRAIRETAPGVRVVALAVPETEPHVLACVEAGIAAYVPREGSLGDLVATVEGVARDEVECHPRIVASLFGRVAALAAERRREPPSGRLTSREIDVIELIDLGLTNREIAERLRIELPTVKNHVHSILEKLQLRRRAEAAAWARRRGLRSRDHGIKV